MDGAAKKPFDSAKYLSTEGIGRQILQVRAKQAFFAQGSPAESVFFLQTGRAKITVVSKRGKEATVTLMGAGDFAGEEAITLGGGLRVGSATALVACTVLKIERNEMLRALHEEHAFSDFFLQFMLLRGIRTQADLIDQLFNSSERRLARTLLLMAEYGEPGEPGTLIPAVTQETLAEIIGTTRSRVSFFMNRFRKLGYIDYDARIWVHRSLLTVVLHDQLPDENAIQAKSSHPATKATAKGQASSMGLNTAARLPLVRQAGYKPALRS